MRSSLFRRFLCHEDNANQLLQGKDGICKEIDRAFSRDEDKKPNWQDTYIPYCLHCEFP